MKYREKWDIFVGINKLWASLKQRIGPRKPKGWPPVVTEKKVETRNHSKNGELLKSLVSRETINWYNNYENNI